MKQRDTSRINTEKLVRIRKHRRKSRTQVAAAVDVTEQTIYNLETGKKGVSDKVVTRVCAFLEIEPSEIEIEVSERKRRAS